MPQLLATPTRIPAPGGKVIDEHVGRLATETDSVSVAHMVAPPHWSEPAQTPEFDEVTLVLRGALHVEHDGGLIVVGAGQSVLTRAGETVRYRTADQETAYVAVCVPAFSPDLAHPAGEEEPSG